MVVQHAEEDVYVQPRALQTKHDIMAAATK